MRTSEKSARSHAAALAAATAALVAVACGRGLLPTADDEAPPAAPLQASQIAAAFGREEIGAQDVATESACTVTRASFTDECAQGYPASACACGAGSACQAAWDNHYWSLQPADLQPLRGNPDAPALARELAREGYCIDAPIMALGGDPAVTTCLRQQAGYPWIPSALQQNIPVGPGISRPGNASDIPVGAIAVPKAVAACPFYVLSWTTLGGAPMCDGDPEPVCQTGYAWNGSCADGWAGICAKGERPSTASLAVVGAIAYGNTFASGPGDTIATYPVGSSYTDARGTFTKVMMTGLFGPEYYWMLE